MVNLKYNIDLDILDFLKQIRKFSNFIQTSTFQVHLIIAFLNLNFEVNWLLFFDPFLDDTTNEDNRRWV